MFSLFLPLGTAPSCSLLFIHCTPQLSRWLQLIATPFTPDPFIWDFRERSNNEVFLLRFRINNYFKSLPGGLKVRRHEAKISLHLCGTWTF